MNKKKISYVSLGCAKNQVDFEYLIGELSNYGFAAETDPAKCDAVIINTCGFIAVSYTHLRAHETSV